MFWRIDRAGSPTRCQARCDPCGGAWRSAGYGEMRPGGSHTEPNGAWVSWVQLLKLRYPADMYNSNCFWHKIMPLRVLRARGRELLRCNSRPSRTDRHCRGPTVVAPGGSISLHDFTVGSAGTLYTKLISSFSPALPHTVTRRPPSPLSWMDLNLATNIVPLCAARRAGQCHCAGRSACVHVLLSWVLCWRFVGMLVTTCGIRSATPMVAPGKKRFWPGVTTVLMPGVIRGRLTYASNNATRAQEVE
jgi:hypothetical protein